MAVFIKATYAKKLGLPQYSSHHYSVEVSTELTDLSDLPQASAELYARLQQAVDAQIIRPGFVPGEASSPPSRPEGGHEEAWKCSDRQRELILKIVSEQKLDRARVDALARERYGQGVKHLNKLQASGLIDELLENAPAGPVRRGARPGLSGARGRT